MGEPWGAFCNLFIKMTETYGERISTHLQIKITDIPGPHSPTENIPACRERQFAAKYHGTWVIDLGAVYDIVTKG